MEYVENGNDILVTCDPMENYIQGIIDLINAQSTLVDAGGNGGSDEAISMMEAVALSGGEDATVETLAVGVGQCAITDFTSADQTKKDVTTNYGSVTGTLESGGGASGGPATMSVGHFNLHTAAGVTAYQSWLNEQVGASGRIKRIYYNEDLHQQIVTWETGE